MPFIERQDRTERVELKEKIRPEVLELLEQYARFVDSERWYVIQEILRKSLAADKDFQGWLKAQHEPEQNTAPVKKVKAVA